jgi:hypothetical protein
MEDNMKNKKKILLMFLSMLMTLIIFVGCNEDVTTETTTTTEEAQTTTFDYTTMDLTTTIETTIETTTQGTTTTEEIPEEYNDLDVLYLSVNRLENAKFDVDFSQIFDDTDSQSQAMKASSYLKDSFVRRMFFPFYVDSVIDTGDYVHHPYWIDMFYHNELFVEPTLTDGYYIFDGGLETYNDTALNNLYECAEGATTQAQLVANWAVDNLTVMDTWVVDENNKYLLNYDSENDIVTVHYFMHIEFDANYIVDSYRKVSVYYNDKGEEVIENWIYEVTTGTDPRQVNVYYNSIGARDFNYYNEELDSEGNSVGRHYRGINKNKDGRFEYYDNSLFMISGDYGWYQVYPRVDFENQQILFDSNPIFKVYNREGTSNVFEIYSVGMDNYRIKVFLPSMSGIDAVIAEEASLLVTNIDAESTQNWLISQGITPLPDIYLFDDDIQYVTGFRTSAGDFLSTDPIYNNSVDLINADINVRPEGVREYSHYYNYVVSLNFNVSASTMESALDEITNYLTNAGVSYEFGDLDNILIETNDVYNNYNNLVKEVTFVNDIFDVDYYPYKEYFNYHNLINYVQEYINILSEELYLIDTYEEVDISEIPNDIGLDDTTFFDLNQIITGTASISSNDIDTSNISITLPQSPIFQRDAEYSIFYSLAVGDKLFVINSEDGVLYNQQAFNLTGSLSEVASFNIPEGEYILTMFVGKVTDSGVIRISNVIPIPFEEFDSLTIVEDYGEYGYYNYNFAYDEGAGYVQKEFVDTMPPYVMISTEPEAIFGEYTFSEEQIFNYGAAIVDLWSLFTYVNDNVDGDMNSFSYENVTHDTEIISSNDDILVPGVYTITFADSSGNETIITLTVRIRYEVSFYDDQYNILEVQGVLNNEDAIPPIVNELTGYTYIWDTDYTNVTDNLVVYLEYIANTHTITYMVDGSVYQVIENVDFGSEIIAIDDPIQEGFTFSGWDYVPGTMPDEDIIISGTFSAN